MVAPADMVVVDRWAVGRAKAVQAEIVAAFDEYNFHGVTQKLMQFCSIEMGSSIWTSSRIASTPPRPTARPVAPARPPSITSPKPWCAGWRPS